MSWLILRISEEKGQKIMCYMFLSKESRIQILKSFMVILFIVLIDEEYS